MPTDDNINKPATNHWFNIGTVASWSYTVSTILVSLYWILYNPGNSFGESEAFRAGVFTIQTYPGQFTALQFTGTFIAVMGVITKLNLFRRIPDVPTVTGILGAAVVMLSQVMQIAQENFLLLAVVIVEVVFVGLSWLLMWLFKLGWAGVKGAYSRIKGYWKSDD